MRSRPLSLVLRQRYAFATLAVGLALLLNLAGWQRAAFAILLGLKALGATPERLLEPRRIFF